MNITTWSKSAPWLGAIALGITAWLLIAIVAMALGGCNDPVIRGSAQEHAAGVEVRARSSATAADQAEVEAARADALARLLGEQASKEPTAARIDAAAKALADARVSAAIATVLRRQATAYASEVTQAEAAARLERQQEADAAAYRSWKRLCDLLGLGALVAGIVVGAIVARYFTVRAGLWAGGVLAGTGCVVVAFGPATSWLPWAVPLAAGLAIGIWAIAHHRLSLSAQADRTLVTRLTTGVATAEDFARAEAARIRAGVHRAEQAVVQAAQKPA